LAVQAELQSMELLAMDMLADALVNQPQRVLEHLACLVQHLADLEQLLVQAEAEAETANMEPVELVVLDQQLTAELAAQDLQVMGTVVAVAVVALLDLVDPLLVEQPVLEPVD
jgi:hypothetical protein